MEIIIATHNINKLKEISAIIPKALFNIRTLSDLKDMPEIEEDGLTLEENALKKARVISLYYNKWALADDTGLEVEFLDGAPGVYSARWAGEKCSYLDNNLKLIKMLEGVPFEKRKAVFRCVIAISSPWGKEKITEGRLEGYILEKMKEKNGFGYDPLFYIPKFKKTLAELSPETKNKISHRAIALKKMKKYLLHLSNSYNEK